MNRRSVNEEVLENLIESTKKQIDSEDLYDQIVGRAAKGTLIALGLWEMEDHDQ